MAKKRALITGITGQDGSYLAEFLLSKGYEVWGMHRRCSVDNYHGRIAHLRGKVNLICADLLDFASLARVIKMIKPDEIYNLASQSQVRVSFDQPFLTREINWLGVERLLDIIKHGSPKTKFYQASTSEMFGDAVTSPQNEETPFNPVSPYGKSKVNAHLAIQRARQEGLFACGGILFNHESPRRGIEFVTRKFTDGIARIKLGLLQRETGKPYLEMGNLDAKRDWGFAGDYVKAMWLMLQQDKPRDYVIATGKNHTIRDFMEAAAKCVGIEITWKGSGKNAKGYDQHGKLILKVNPKFFRPAEVHHLLGDSTKARKELGWHPEVSFEQMVEMMVKADINRIAKTEKNQQS
jgi:GDPmannose 4,6-dehydratase